MRRALGPSLMLALVGCAQLFGLDDTTYAPQDAPADAPGVCDGAPACTSTTGRSVCGQLISTGALAEQPFRIDDPTGAPCAPGATTGPCLMTVAAMPVASLFDGSMTGSVAGTLDDCGRFVVPDVDPAAADVAVVFEGATGYHRTITLLLSRPPGPGTDLGVVGRIVPDAVLAAWGAELGAGSTDLSAGFLVRYTTTPDSPLEGEQVARDGGSALANPVGTVPWAAYFGGTTSFGALDPAAMATGATGTAFTVLGSGTFSLDGFRPGRRCRLMDLQQIANTLIYVNPTGC